MVDGENIIYKPDHIEFIVFFKILDLIGHQSGTSSPVTGSIHGAAAPFTTIGTAPHGAEIYYARAVVFFPNFEIFFKCDLIPCWKWQLVNIPDQDPLRIRYDILVCIEIS